jgi:hypothetical protein
MSNNTILGTGTYGQAPQSRVVLAGSVSEPRFLDAIIARAAAAITQETDYRLRDAHTQATLLSL